MAVFLNNPIKHSNHYRPSHYKICSCFFSIYIDRFSLAIPPLRPMAAAKMEELTSGASGRIIPVF